MQVLRTAAYSGVGRNFPMATPMDESCISKSECPMSVEPKNTEYDVTAV